MSIRYHKRLRIFPGVWLNFSKSGISISFGGYGLTENIGPKGHQETISLLPGTGISYRDKRRPL